MSCRGRGSCWWRRSRSGRISLGFLSYQYLEGVNRLLDVLHFLCTFAFEAQFKLAAHLIMKLSGDKDTSRFCCWFKPCCHVDTFSVEVVSFNYHIPHIQTHPELHLVFWIYFVISIMQVFLELHCRHDGVYRTAEFGNYWISGTTKYSSVMRLNRFIG